MDSFQTFFERRERNPLRKKELEGTQSYLDYVNQNKDILSPEKEEQIQKMEELGVEPERIETFRKAKLAEREKELKKYLQPKITNKHNKILTRFGIEVYTDETVGKDFTNPYNLKMLNFSINHLVLNYKDILPNRKPKIIISDMKKNPLAKGKWATGETDTPPGLYYRRMIYIDQYYVDDPDLLVHEYAHFVADRIPKQTEKILQKEYTNMLSSYFEKKTRRKSLKGKNNEELRIKVAEKLGLPSPYSTVNFDEWFAEVISHWKKMPNNANSYRFKTAMKKILTRI